MRKTVLIYVAMGVIGLILFDSNDIHKMLFGLWAMLAAIMGFMIDGALEKKIGELDSKLDSIERHLNR